jgi:hypothetical protein
MGWILGLYRLAELASQGRARYTCIRGRLRILSQEGVSEKGCIRGGTCSGAWQTCNNNMGPGLWNLVDGTGWASLAGTRLKSHQASKNEQGIMSMGFYGGRV